MKTTIVTSLFLLLTFTTAGWSQSSQESAFKDALLAAFASNDKSALVALTYFGDASDDWKLQISASNDALLSIPGIAKPTSVTFSPITAQPAPIKYKDTELVPSLPLTTLCTLATPNNNSGSLSTSLNLGEKDGKLWISTLVPKAK